VALVTTVRGHLYAPYIIFKNKSGSQLKVRERNGPPSPSPAVIMFQKSGFMNHELWMYVLKSLLERPDSTAFETYHSAATAPASAAASASAATATSASAAASALAPALARLCFLHLHLLHPPLLLHLLLLFSVGPESCS
jgi:hypothetical protein